MTGQLSDSAGVRPKDSAGAASSSRWERDSVLVVLCVVGLIIVAWLLLRADAPLARSTALAMDQAIGVVTQAHTGVRRRAAKHLAWEAVSPGDPAFDNDTIFVPPGADAVLVLHDGSRLSLEANSLIVLQAPEKSDAFSVFVSRGSVVGETEQGGLTIATDRGALELKNEAQARLSVEKDTTLEMFRGNATVSADGQATSLARNQAAALVAGRVSDQKSYAVTLLEPPPGRRFFVPKIQSVHLAWRGGTPGARLRVARERSLQNPVQETAADSGRADLPLGPGTYYWAVFAAGERVSPTGSFTVMNDAPPRPLSPRHLELLTRTVLDAVPFAWTRAPGADTYVLELSEDERFASLLKRVETAQTRVWVSADLPEGVFHWRVRALGHERAAPVTSGTFSFRLTHAPLPDTPEVFDAEVELAPPH